MLQKLLFITLTWITWRDSSLICWIVITLVKFHKEHPKWKNSRKGMSLTLTRITHTHTHTHSLSLSLAGTHARARTYTRLTFRHMFRWLKQKDRAWVAKVQETRESLLRWQKQKSRFLCNKRQEEKETEKPLGTQSLRVGSSSTKVSHRYEDIYLSTLRCSQPTSQSLLLFNYCHNLNQGLLAGLFKEGKEVKWGAAACFFFLLSKIELRVHKWAKHPSANLRLFS